MGKTPEENLNVLRRVQFRFTWRRSTTLGIS
jgi:hypothetical protein